MKIKKKNWTEKLRLTEHSNMLVQIESGNSGSDGGGCIYSKAAFLICHLRFAYRDYHEILSI